MARLAGNKSDYTFVLRNENTGRMVKDVSIAFPSVTTVIGATLAKPQLVPWAYQRTVDSVAGGIDQLVNKQLMDKDDVLDIVTDPFELAEFLAQNKLRPADVRDEAADRGHIGHDVLEKLAGCQLTHDHDAAVALAKRIQASATNGWEHGIAQWWLDASPDVVMSEAVLYSLVERFCGSVDLVWRDQDERLVITDLKTRGKGKGIYTSDQIQVGAYDIAYADMYGSRADVLSVLVIEEDGTIVYKENSFDAGRVFLNLLDSYNVMKGVK